MMKTLLILLILCFAACASAPEGQQTDVPPNMLEAVEQHAAIKFYAPKVQTLSVRRFPNDVFYVTAFFHYTDPQNRPASATKDYIVQKAQDASGAGYWQVLEPTKDRMRVLNIRITE